MSWLRRLIGGPRPGERAAVGREAVPPPVDPAADDLDLDALDAASADAFVCSTCGRTDLPEVGGWDPPICQECDAAINFDAILEHEAFDDR